MTANVEAGPGLLNIRARQGTKLALVFTYRDDAGELVNLTGYTVRAQFRQTLTADPFLDLDNDQNGGLEVTGPGVVVLTVSATDMAQVTDTYGVWDLELVPPSGEDDAFALLAGKWAMEKEVTR